MEVVKWKCVRDSSERVAERRAQAHTKRIGSSKNSSSYNNKFHCGAKALSPPSLKSPVAAQVARLDAKKLAKSCNLGRRSNFAPLPAARICRLTCCLHCSQIS